MIRIIFLLALLLIGQSCGYQDGLQVIDEVKATCNKYGHSCKVVIKQSDWKNAMTNYDTIYVSSKLIEMLTADELRTVLYHEAGHAVLNHSQDLMKVYPKIKDLDNIQQHHIIHNYRLHKEFEADKFAIKELMIQNKPVRLTSALEKISGKKRAESFTHPSHLDRAQSAELIMKVYKNGKK